MWSAIDALQRKKDAVSESICLQRCGLQYRFDVNSKPPLFNEEDWQNHLPKKPVTSYDSFILMNHDEPLKETVRGVQDAGFHHPTGGGQNGYHYIILMINNLELEQRLINSMNKMITTTIKDIWYRIYLNRFLLSVVESAFLP